MQLFQYYRNHLSFFDQYQTLALYFCDIAPNDIYANKKLNNIYTRAREECIAFAFI